MAKASNEDPRPCIVGLVATSSPVWHRDKLQNRSSRVHNLRRLDVLASHYNAKQRRLQPSASLLFWEALGPKPLLHISLPSSHFSPGAEVESASPGAEVEPATVGAPMDLDVGPV